jgi:site-specific recombinase XerD
MEQRDIQPDAGGTPKRRNVKRAEAAEVVDAHERTERDFLTPAEMDALLRAAKAGRYGQRDYAMMLVAYRHGLRVSELVSLTRRDVSLAEARIWCARRKNGLSTSQPLQGDELRALRAYLNKRDDALPWLFVSSQGGQMTRQNINYLIAEAGQRAGLGHINPHMLRHSCGHALADKGTDTRLMQDWLGHRDIRHTAWYSRTSAKRFEGVWG